MSRADGLVVFEDARWRDLRPLTDLLPVPALAFGASSLLVRWRRAVDLPLRAVLARPEAMACWYDAPAIAPGGGTVLAVNAAALPGPWLDRVRAEEGPALYRSGEAIVAARVDAPAVAGGRGKPLDTHLAGLELPERAVEAERIVWPWDLIARNADALAADLRGMAPERPGQVHPQAVLIEPDRIAVAAGARVDPLAVLDARGGPIRIDAGAVVLPHTVVAGPCVVGPGTQLLGGFVGRSTFGPECRIAGEVEECVWQGWSNKRHHGFVGHSVVAPWVNLGALTTTSDLKNNYGPVRVWIDGREIDSGQSKVGSIIGAHVKTGIGTLLPTGASIGAGSNLFGGGTFTPKSVPAFSWWDGERFVTHRIEPFLATARMALSRRGRRLEGGEERALRGLFEATAAERAMLDSADTASHVKQAG